MRGRIHTGERMANLLWAHHLRWGPRVRWQLANVNGELGLLRFIDGELESVQAMRTDGQRIVAIHSVRNPEKLAGLAAPAAD